MSKTIIAIIIIIIVAGLGYWIYQSTLTPEEESKESLLTKEEALTIAQASSDCSMAGVLTDEINYNTNTKTWWIDLERMPELENDGCNPACVVSEATKTAEVNWRCTGLLPETEKAYILTLMDQISDIIGIDRDPTPTEAMAITVKWNTEEDEEMEYNGIGYGMGDVIGSETIRSQHNSINDLLRQEGFITDVHNAMSGFTIRYKKDNIVCNLTKREVELKGATDMQIACADTENPLIIFEAVGIGGERDQYGCLGPAGYKWDAEVFACIREWELGQDQRRAAKMSAYSVGWEKGMTILEVKPTGCTGCFTVNLEHGAKRTQTSIENWLVTDITDLIN